AGLHLAASNSDVSYTGNGDVSVTNASITGLVLNTSGNGAITVGTSGAPVSANFSGGKVLAAVAASGPIAVFLNGGSLASLDSNGVGLELA
ncbi:hypothetical protein, partial [Escherichia coli]|uniref:hypothetical protein n=1 Tax=Escherichia coli TaxID=562 RepID=UPI0013D4D165